MDLSADEQDVLHCMLYRECPLPDLTAEAYESLLQVLLDECWRDAVMLYARYPLPDAVYGGLASDVKQDEVEDACQVLFRLFSWEFLDFAFFQSLGVLGTHLLGREWAGWSAEFEAVAAGHDFYQRNPSVVARLLLPMIYRSLCLYQPLVMALQYRFRSTYSVALLQAVAIDALVLSLNRFYAELTSSPVYQVLEDTV
jgi:hypothetical protein